MFAIYRDCVDSGSGAGDYLNHDGLFNFAKIAAADADRRRGHRGRTSSCRWFAWGLFWWWRFRRGFWRPMRSNHYLIGKWDSLQDWHLWLGIWGRPLCTMLYSLGTPWGLVGSRLISGRGDVAGLLGDGAAVESILPPPERPGRFLIATARHGYGWALFAQPFFLLNKRHGDDGNGCCRSAGRGRRCGYAERRIILASVAIGIGGISARPEGFLRSRRGRFFCGFGERWGWKKAVGLIVALGGATEPTHDSRVALEYAGAPAPWRGWRILLGTFLGGLPVLLWLITGILAFHNVLWVRDNWPWSAISQYGASTSRFLDSLWSGRAFPVDSGGDRGNCVCARPGATGDAYPGLAGGGICAAARPVGGAGIVWIDGLAAVLCVCRAADCDSGGLGWLDCCGQHNAGAGGGTVGRHRGAFDWDALHWGISADP